MLKIDQLNYYWSKYPYTTFITLNSESRSYRLNSSPLKAPWKYKLKGHRIYLDEKCLIFNSMKFNNKGNAVVILDDQLGALSILIIKLPKFYNQDALISDPRIKKIHLI
jgi:hypothetical protein